MRCLGNASNGYYVFGITRASIHFGRWNFRNEKNTHFRRPKRYGVCTHCCTQIQPSIRHRWYSTLSTFLVMCQVRFFILMLRSVVETVTRRQHFSHARWCLHIIWCECTSGWETTRCNFHFENDCVIVGDCRGTCIRHTKINKKKKNRIVLFIFYLNDCVAILYARRTAIHPMTQASRFPKKMSLPRLFSLLFAIIIRVLRLFFFSIAPFWFGWIEGTILILGLRMDSAVWVRAWMNRSVHLQSDTHSFRHRMA